MKSIVHKLIIFERYVWDLFLCNYIFNIHYSITRYSMLVFFINQYLFSREMIFLPDLSDGETSDNMANIDVEDDDEVVLNSNPGFNR